MLILKKKRKV